MRWTRNLWPTILLILIAIGILSSLRQLLVPIIVIGVILILYFYPPDRWRNIRFRAPRRGSRTKYRTGKFKVIRGGKRKDDDEPPRYH